MATPLVTDGTQTKREQMDRLAEEIKASMAESPDDFDAREELWMQRENLRAGL